MKTSKLSLPLALALAAVVSASPVLAQGNSGKGRGHGKQEQRDNRGNRDRDRDRDRDDDRFSRRDDRFERSTVFAGNRFEISRDRRTLLRNGRRVPPGWCRGRGNPHNTPENCGGWSHSQSRSIWDWIGISSGDRRDDRRWDDRLDTRRRSSSGSFSGSHSEFHRYHDQRCRELAAQAGTNLRRLVEIRATCKAEHDDWHRRTGTRH
jgi:Ni/Co efflux regulator RcnB